MRNALMTVATVAAFVFVATGPADAQKSTLGTAATQTTPTTRGLTPDSSAGHSGKAPGSSPVQHSGKAPRKPTYQSR